jgi:hypothetical protein
MAKEQSKLSRYAGDTNFLLGAIRRLRGALYYLHDAPKDEEFEQDRIQVLRLLAKMEARAAVLRKEGLEKLYAQRALDRALKEKENGQTPGST